MDNIKVLKRLMDILASIDSIESFVARFPKQFQVFHSEPMYRSAVLYHIAIVGEALNQTLKLYPEIKISSVRWFPTVSIPTIATSGKKHIQSEQ